jgi:GNAT superfamily N-acetyltransferase
VTLTATRGARDEETEPVIHSDPEIMGGTPVFVGTRVPLETLLDYLEAGQPLSEFLEANRCTSRRDACAGLIGMTGRMAAYEIRRAKPSDVNDIAMAHRDSIQFVGPSYYPEEIVGYWQEAIEGQLYLKALDGGEVFFIAVGDFDGRRAVLGFASDYCIEGQRHGSSVYVRGRSARQGIGSALLARAEAHAISNGATSIEIEASLAGVDFYRANGFIEVGRGETRLTTGRSMECVFMRKELSAVTP